MVWLNNWNNRSENWYSWISREACVVETTPTQVSSLQPGTLLETNSMADILLVAHFVFLSSSIATSVPPPFLCSTCLTSLVICSELFSLSCSLCLFWENSTEKKKRLWWTVFWWSFFPNFLKWNLEAILKPFPWNHWDHILIAIKWLLNGILDW